MRFAYVLAGAETSEISKMLNLNDWDGGRAQTRTVDLLRVNYQGELFFVSRG